MAESPKKRGRKPDRHKKSLLPARVDNRVRQAIQICADGERRSLAQMIAILLEEALLARGLWPPHD